MAKQQGERNAASGPEWSQFGGKSQKTVQSPSLPKGNNSLCSNYLRLSFRMGLAEVLSEVISAGCRRSPIWPSSKIHTTYWQGKIQMGLKFTDMRNFWLHFPNTPNPPHPSKINPIQMGLMTKWYNDKVTRCDTLPKVKSTKFLITNICKYH